MHSGQETDMSILSGESGPQKNVQKPLGEATHSVRTVARLYSVLCGVVTNHPGLCSADISCVKSRVMLAII